MYCPLVGLQHRIGFLSFAQIFCDFCGILSVQKVGINFLYIFGPLIVNDGLTIPIFFIAKWDG